MGSYRDELRDGLSQAAAGHDATAICLLRLAFDRAVLDAESDWISLIGRNLALVCQHAGRSRDARDYLLKTLAHVPGDRTTLYQLGELHSQIGDQRAAAEAFAECLRLSRDADDPALIELLLSRGYS